MTGMTRRLWSPILVSTVLGVLCVPAIAQSASALETIAGTWRGTSTCTDRVAAPACTDEQVIYDIAAVTGSSNKVTVKADKVVDGKRVPMGTMDFTLDKDDTWTTEFETPRVHGRWELVVTGTAMKGTLTVLPSKAVVRRVELKKDK